MRCQCCNRVLSNSESTRKFSSGTYTDMCNKCLSTIDDDVVVVDSDNDGEEEILDEDGR